MREIVKGERDKCDNNKNKQQIMRILSKESGNEVV